jgi:DNA-binding NarL/FixJ family response regulator
MSPEEPRLAAGTDPTLRVLVAVPIPLQRSLVQFFMQEAGFDLLPTPLPNVNGAQLAAHEHPDAIVRHVSGAKAWDSDLVSAVRRESPSTRVVVLAQAPDEAWAGPARGADAYLEEWVGIAELEGVLRDVCNGGSALVAAASAQTMGSAAGDPLVTEDAEQETRMPAAPARSRGGRWYERIQGAAAAAIIVFALLRVPGMFQETASIQGPAGDADAGLAGAYDS